jgi:methionine-rich copper-binding protein CopC
MSNNLSHIGISVLAALLMSEPALEHAVLEHASPAAGAQIRPAPQTCDLAFSEQLEPAFCKLEVQAPGGSSVSAPPDVAGSVMHTRLKPLAAGNYRVICSRVVGYACHRWQLHVHSEP